MNAKHPTIELTQNLGTGVAPPMSGARGAGSGRAHTAARSGGRAAPREKPELAGRQAMILEFISDFVGRNSFPPTVREIGRGCTISSTSVVDYNLSVLEVKGYLTRIPSIARGIVLTKRGQVESGNYQGC